LVANCVATDSESTSCCASAMALGVGDTGGLEPFDGPVMRERNDDRKFTVDSLSRLQIFRIERGAARKKSGSNDQRVVDVKGVAFGEPPGAIMRLEGEWLDTTHGSDDGHGLPYLAPRHAELAPRDRDELVERLHRDEAPARQERFGAIGLCWIGGKQIQHYIRVVEWLRHAH
jgi:hypothetical protein